MDEGVKALELVGTGAQFPIIMEGLCTIFGLKIYPLGGLINLEGTRDILRVIFLYQVYPCIMKNCFLSVILDNKYGDRFQAQLDTLVIDHLVVTITMEELEQHYNLETDILKHCNFKKNIREDHTIPEHNLEGVKGKV